MPEITEGTSSSAVIPIDIANLDTPPDNTGVVIYTHDETSASHHRRLQHGDGSQAMAGFDTSETGEFFDEQIRHTLFSNLAAYSDRAILTQENLRRNNALLIQQEYIREKVEQLYTALDLFSPRLSDALSAKIKEEATIFVVEWIAMSCLDLEDGSLTREDVDDIVVYAQNMPPIQKKWLQNFIENAYNLSCEYKKCDNADVEKQFAIIFQDEMNLTAKLLRYDKIINVLNNINSGDAEKIIRAQLEPYFMMVSEHEDLMLSDVHLLDHGRRIAAVYSKDESNQFCHVQLCYLDPALDNFWRNVPATIFNNEEQQFSVYKASGLSTSCVQSALHYFCRSKQNFQMLTGPGVNDGRESININEQVAGDKAFLTQGVWNDHYWHAINEARVRPLFYCPTNEFMLAGTNSWVYVFSGECLEDIDETGHLDEASHLDEMGHIDDTGNDVEYIFVFLSEPDKERVKLVSFECCRFDSWASGDCGSQLLIDFINRPERQPSEQIMSLELEAAKAIASFEADKDGRLSDSHSVVLALAEEEDTA